MSDNFTELEKEFIDTSLDVARTQANRRKTLAVAVATVLLLLFASLAGVAWVRSVQATRALEAAQAANTKAAQRFNDILTIAAEPTSTLTATARPPGPAPYRH